MIYLKVSEEGGLDKSLKKLKKKFEKTRVMKELRKRKEFKKKSVERREEILKAEYIQKTYRNEL